MYGVRIAHCTKAPHVLHHRVDTRDCVHRCGDSAGPKAQAPMGTQDHARLGKLESKITCGSTHVWQLPPDSSTFLASSRSCLSPAHHSQSLSSLTAGLKTWHDPRSPPVGANRGGRGVGVVGHLCTWPSGRCSLFIVRPAALWALRSSPEQTWTIVQ